MYYKKHFQGSVESETASTYLYKIDSTTKQASSTKLYSNAGYGNRQRIIGNALASTLKDCGLNNAYYDETAGYLFFDKTNCNNGIYIYIITNNIVFYFGGKLPSSSDTLVGYYGSSSASTSTYNPFSSTSGAGNYNFYVTVKGDTQSVFTVSIGKYSEPSSERNIKLLFCKANNVTNNESYWGFSCLFGSVSNTPQFYLVDTSSVPTGLPMYSSSTSTYVLIDSTCLTMSDEQYIIPAYFNYPIISLPNVYFCNFSVDDSFYEIDGDIYYKYNNILIKCTTIPTPSNNGGGD